MTHVAAHGTIGMLTCGVCLFFKTSGVTPQRAFKKKDVFARVKKSWIRNTEA
jgi:hypothetical protein